MGNYVSLNLGRMAGREMAWDAETRLHAVDLTRLDDLDGKAGCPDVVSPAVTAAAVRVFGDNELRQLLRSERAATSRESRHSGKRTHKAASRQHLHRMAPQDTGRRLIRGSKCEF